MTFKTGIRGPDAIGDYTEMPANREGLRAMSVKEQTDLMQFGQQMESSVSWLPNN
jgi:hypothetical protein